MIEVELRDLFNRFLIEEKKYPEDALVYEARLPKINNRAFMADLLILGLSIGEYIGLIEFKSHTIAANKSVILNQVKAYRNSLKKPNIPTFIVSDKEGNLIIYKVTEDYDIIEITKNEFPSYAALNTEYLETTNLSELENLQKKEKEKNRNQKIRYLTSLTAVLITLFVTIFTFFIGDIFKPSGGKYYDSKYYLVYLDSLKSKLSEQQTQINILLDSIKMNSNKNQIIQNYLKDSLKVNNNLDYLIDISELKQEHLTITQHIKDLQKYYNELLELISNDPIKTLKIAKIQNDILLLENSLSNRIELLQKDNSSLEEKYNFIVGGIITLIASILLLAVPNLIRVRRE